MVREVWNISRSQTGLLDLVFRRVKTANVSICLLFRQKIS